MTGQHSTGYREALASPHWRRMRELVKVRAKYVCERCGVGGDGLAVHHLTYDRLGRERLEDLILVCPQCHEDEDRRRANRTAERQEEALWSARLDGWATKVYGEDWDYYQDAESVAEEFDRWLDGRDGAA